ncbi:MULTISPECIES: hypothetical protein [Delftia]|uniref:hypothetical protein n=1 Tax=Delftia TaxID=80865 RepID=UPI000F8464D1|nr:hypothetical protein [Delftia acidovorans]
MAEPQNICGKAWDWLKANPWSSSAAEVLFTLLLSNAAVLIAAYVFMLNQTEPVEVSVWGVFTEQLQKFIKPTEIIVFILAIVAPAIWILLKNVEGWRHLQWWAALLCGQFFVVLISTLIFATSLAGFANNKGLTNASALGCLGLAIIIWYVTLVYQKTVIENSSRQIKKPKPGESSGDEILNTLKGQ